MKKLLPKRKPDRKPSEEDFAVRKSKCEGTMGQKNKRKVETDQVCFKLPQKMVQKKEFDFI